MADTRRLVELGMVPPLAQEVASQIGSADNAAVAALTPVTTPDASSPETVITLANANKAKINEIIAALAP